jgi:eight-cysteine-cluster-containing protein
MRLAIFFALAFLACTTAPAPRADVAAAAAPAAPARTPAVPKDSPNYDIFEGTSYKNACTTDADCHIGGCSKEVCSAEARIMSSCIVREDQPRGAGCGCVGGECVWYR